MRVVLPLCEMLLRSHKGGQTAATLTTEEKAAVRNLGKLSSWPKVVANDVSTAMMIFDKILGASNQPTYAVDMSKLTVIYLYSEDY